MMVMSRDFARRCSLLVLVFLGSTFWFDNVAIFALRRKTASLHEEVASGVNKRSPLDEPDIDRECRKLAIENLREDNGATLDANDEQGSKPTLKSMLPTDTVDSNSHNMTTMEERRQAVPQRVLLSTWVFGEQAVKLRRFQMFVETASTSGFDLVIVGDPAPSFALPPHVHHFPLTWDELVDRLLDKVFAGQAVDPTQVQQLRDSSRYKVCDFRPLFAYLFPEQVAGYQWWGHVDNDMVLGNLTKFFPLDKLQRYDILAGAGHAWGPLTLYRNAPPVNSLFLKVAKYAPLEDLFLTNRNVLFDEWGDESAGPGYLQKSMTGVIKEFASQLGLKRDGGRVDKGLVMWDMGECHQDPKMHVLEQLPERCAECLYQRHGGTNGQVLTRVRDGKERALCHYQGSKNVRQEESLKDISKFEALRQGGSFRVNWQEGFDYASSR